jgi:S-DNA-T family DNA segregation ATPase FtsK/SpoIIIE
MMSLPTIVDKRLKAAMPAKSAWIEAWGFVLMGFGLYLALACYTFSPYDFTASGIAPKVSNLAGPAGAWTASQVLGRFGVIGMLWPIVFAVWGILTATGFVVLPKPRRFIGFVALAIDVAGFAEMLLPKTGLPEPSFGFGGMIGYMLKKSFLPQMGEGGTLIALAVIGIVAMVLTDNLNFSRTAARTADLWYWSKKKARKLWIKYVLNEDPAGAAPAGAAALKRGMVAAPVRAGVTAGGEDEAQAKAAAKRAAKEEAQGIQAMMAAAPQPGALDIELFYDGPAHGKPDPKMFAKSKAAPDRSKDFEKTGKMLASQLAEFKINGEITGVTQGPVVTTYEFKPAPGTKVSKIAALSEDLARLLSASSLRVLAPIPGKDTVGFEVPNAERATIGYQDLLEDKEFKATKRKLPIAMGVDIFGKTIVEDLAEMPHLLVAGSTGSGKSVFMNTLIASLIARHTAQTLRLIMIDPKMVEMAAYNGLPHMACPVITDPQTEAKQALDALVTEMDDRYRRMRAVGARNIEGFNEIVKTKRKSEFDEFEGRWAPMPFVVLIVDELADMMMLLGKDVETPITRLAQKARACGIHLVIATQRPSADVVTGLIKANFPTRVAFRVLSGVDSRTILDTSGAEGLLGKGDMLFMAAGGLRRLHGAYLAESEVQDMVKACGRGKK